MLHRVSCQTVTALALGFLVTGLLAFTASALPAEDEDWLRLETSHFTFFSNADEDVLRRVGGEMETLRSALSRWMGPLEVHSPLPTWVYVFRDEESFRPYKVGLKGDSNNVAGFFLSHPLGNYVAVNGSPRISPSQVIYHEYLHSFINDNLPGVPLWFNEGLAELYSTFRVEAEQAVVGMAPPRHRRWLKLHGPSSLSGLFEVDQSLPDYNEDDRRGGFYATSWALVHYFMVGNPERGGQLIDFLASLGRESSVEEVFSSAFDASFAELEEELGKYLAQPNLPLLRVGVGELAADSQGELAELPLAEAYFRLGDLLLHAAPGAAEQSDEHFDLALRLAPDLGGAWAGLGQLKDLLGSYDEAQAFYEKGLELAPGDFRTHYLYGRSLMLPLALRGVASASRDADFLPRIETAIRAFRRSEELQPGFPEALAGLGAAWAYHPEPQAEAIVALEEARRRMPLRMDVAFNLTVLYARLGRRPEAQRMIDAVLEPSGKAEVADAAREVLLRADLEVADRFLRAGRLEEGYALVEKVAAATTDPALEQRLRRQLAKKPENSSP